MTMAALTRRAELAEAQAFASMMRAAPQSLAAPMGMHVVTARAAVGGFVARADVLAFNRIVGLGVDGPATEAQVAQLLDVARTAGVRRCFVHLAPDAEPPALVDWVTAHGGRLYNRWVRLWRSTTTVPAAPTDLRVAEVERSDAARFGAVVAEGFGMPPATGAWLAELPERAGWHAVAAYDDDALVAGACLHVADGTGWLGIASTALSHRGRGAQSALIAHRLVIARDLGCELVVVETAEESRERPIVPSYRNLRRLGFTEAYRRPNHLVVTAP